LLLLLLLAREVYSATAAKGGVARLMSLQDPEWMGSVNSRVAFHPDPAVDVVVGVNSSGRCHIFWDGKLGV
jgi:hypothetical protein